MVFTADSPRVTVMVANYNTARYLPECLDSLLNQTYQDFEVLIIDDGSTDNSLEICQKYVADDVRFRLMRLESNQGLTYARHVGLRESKGKYIAILDADDLATPSRLQRQVEYLEAHPDVILLGSYYSIVDEEGQIHRRRKKVPTNDIEIRWKLTFGNCLIHSTIIYRREAALKCGGYDLNIKRGEDIELHSKLIAYGKAAVLPEVLACWRSHKKSMTKSVDAREMEKYYVRVVQNAIKLHTSQHVEYNTAYSAFFNTSNPAVNSIAFYKSLLVLDNAYKKFSQNLCGFENQFLSKCLMFSLFRLQKRNKNQHWWLQQKGNWESTFLNLLKKYNYRWYFDRTLFIPQPTLTIKQFGILIRLSIFSLFRQRKVIESEEYNLINPE
jgi:glycosyltransferase involved in cell wall biosynthesis